jgi:hypothetical protein
VNWIVSRASPITFATFFFPADLARSTTSHSSGSWYFEMTIDAATNVGEVGIGVDNNTESLTLAAGRAGSICWRGNGAVHYNGIQGAYTAAPFSVGDVARVDTDLTAKTIRFAVNGGSFTSTFSIAAIVTGPMFALAQLKDPGDQITANFTGVPAFAFTAPSTAWG